MTDIHGNKQSGLSRCVRKAAGGPSDEQLALINQYTLAELGPDDVYVRTAYLAHNGIDRDKEVFDDALLSEFTRTLPGKGVFIKHPGGWDGDSGPGAGRWFEARVVEMSVDEARSVLREPGLRFPDGTVTAKLFETSFYIPRSGKNQDLIADIDAGVAGDVSIGFRASQRSDITDGDGNVIARRLHAPGEALEGSIVWLGAQPGARIHKSASARSTTETEDDNMTTKTAAELQTELDNANSKASTLQTELEQHKASTATLGQIKDAVGEEMLNNLPGLKQVIADGKAYREELISGVCKAKRLLGLMGDSDEDLKNAEAFYAGMSIDMLKGERDAMIKKLPEGAQLDGGDTNTTGAEECEGTGKGLRDASVTQKSMTDLGYKKAS